MSLRHTITNIDLDNNGHVIAIRGIGKAKDFQTPRPHIYLDCPQCHHLVNTELYSSKIHCTACGFTGLRYLFHQPEES